MRQNRLNADLDKINKLSKGDNPQQALQTMLVCAVVVGGLILLNRFGDHGEEGQSATPLTGPLSSYVVHPAAQDLLSCRASWCTVAVIAPVLAQVSEQRSARYLAPAVQTIVAPTGQVFRSTKSFRFEWQTHWIKEPTGYTLVHLSGADAGADGQVPASGDAVKVPTIGYVRSVKLANSTQQISLGGTVAGAGAQASLYEGAAGQQRLRADNPPIAAVAFQPLDTKMRFELADTPALSLTVGDAVKLLFDPAVIPDQDGAAKPASRDEVVAEVVNLTRSGSPASVHLQLSLSDDQAYRLLTDRVAIERALGQPAFPEHMLLELFPRFGRGADQLVRLPASAIVRDGQDAYVWLVVDEMAVPIWVHEVERGEQSSVVVEKIGARGLPIRPDHWRALSAYGRCRVFLAAGNLDDVKLNRFLSPAARVIARPYDKLQAGSKVRSLNATSS